MSKTRGLAPYRASPINTPEDAKRILKDAMDTLDRLCGVKEGSTYRAMNVKEVK